MRSLKYFYWVDEGAKFHHWNHLRKVNFLINHGIDAELLIFVSKNNYQNNYEEIYKKLEGNIRIKVKWGRLHRLQFFFFILLRCLFKKTVLISLRNSIAMNKIAYLVRKMVPRLRMVVEFEGDKASELNYISPNIDSSDAIKDDLVQISFADYVILRSEYHKELWAGRGVKNFKSIILPDIFSTEFKFSHEARIRLRKELGIPDLRPVIVYSGNINNPWQRFKDTVEFLEKIRKKGYEFTFLALVTGDKSEKAFELIEESLISEISIITTVPFKHLNEYLSLADFGLFLREKHPMNLAVSSGKLGEYLATGLRIISTGHFAYYDKFCNKNQLLVKVSDDLQVSDSFLKSLQESSDLDIHERSKRSQEAHQIFLENHPFNKLILEF